MRTVILAGSLALSACSVLDGDPFADPLLSVYEVALESPDPAAELRGRLGLTFVPSDAIAPGCAVQGAYRGRWELDGGGEARPAGGGDVRGGLECDGRTVRLYLFDGGADGGALYELEGVEDGERLSGTWERVGRYPDGAFEARRVRAATEFVTVP